MSLNLKIRHEAEADLAAAMQWYGERREGLATTFCFVLRKCSSGFVKSQEPIQLFTRTCTEQ